MNASRSADELEQAADGVRAEGNEVMAQLADLSNSTPPGHSPGVPDSHLPSTAL